jgi:hypothetical protein
LKCVNCQGPVLFTVRACLPCTQDWRHARLLHFHRALSRSFPPLCVPCAPTPPTRSHGPRSCNLAVLLWCAAALVGIGGLHHPFIPNATYEVLDEEIRLFAASRLTKMMSSLQPYSLWKEEVIEDAEKYSKDSYKMLLAVPWER